MTIRETRRILLDGNVVDVVRQGDTLVAHDGREVGIADATHLAAGRPVEDRLRPPELPRRGSRR